MKRVIIAVGAVLACSSFGPAVAGEASFGCEARAPAACHFRIFYANRGGRVVILAAGMTSKVPGVEVGKDQYCRTFGKTPAYRCAKKPIGASYNG